MSSTNLIQWCSGCIVIHMETQSILFHMQTCRMQWIMFIIFHPLVSFCFCYTSIAINWYLIEGDIHKTLLDNLWRGTDAGNHRNLPFKLGRIWVDSVVDVLAVIVVIFVVLVVINPKQAGAVLGSTSQLKPSFILIDNVSMKRLWIREDYVSLMSWGFYNLILLFLLFWLYLLLLIPIIFSCGQ